MNEIKSFERAYKQLKAHDQNIVREIIMKRCDWSHQTFSNKKNGYRKLKAGKPGFEVAESDVVESTFKGYNLDAWTGDPIYSSEPCLIT